MNPKHSQASKPQPALPPAVEHPPIKWLPIEGAELAPRAYMIATSAEGENATPAIRKPTRTQTGLQWHKRFKWVRFLGGAEIPFTPTHYSELPEGWMFQS